MKMIIPPDRSQAFVAQSGISIKRSVDNAPVSLTTGLRAIWNSIAAKRGFWDFTRPPCFHFLGQLRKIEKLDPLSLVMNGITEHDGVNPGSKHCPLTRLHVREPIVSRGGIFVFSDSREWPKSLLTFILLNVGKALKNDGWFCCRNSSAKSACSLLSASNGMLTGSTVGLQEQYESHVSLADHISESDDEEAADSTKILYSASFNELCSCHVQYDTVIWVLISLLLVLAWGIGIIMLLCLPVRRYLLRKVILSRKLYVTPNEIVYKVTKPSFLPFMRLRKIEKLVPLHLVIDVIIEQGCLQSIYGIHTFRVESVARGKAAHVDELQVQGLSDPQLLKKVILAEASKIIQETGKIWKPTIYGNEGATPRKVVRSLAGVPSFSKAPSSKEGMNAQWYSSPVARSIVPHDVLFGKLEEVKQSVQRIELLVGGSQIS
ncbi:hypothetical protein H6P81_016929 [Aristolochia fimbriata]|uniref:DUF7642 domain-containing protein n=1 Tax=Aristolochia fimbriata TaxID=158543 RepID=A0AAV7DWQ7_ARIFI|nr:hypothetical protein H6P81_016929 [Aristolochia fimbriata]